MALQADGTYVPLNITIKLQAQNISKNYINIFYTNINNKWQQMVGVRTTWFSNLIITIIPQIQHHTSILDKTKGSTLPKYKHKTWTAKRGASNSCFYADKIKFIFNL